MDQKTLGKKENLCTIFNKNIFKKKVLGYVYLTWTWRRLLHVSVPRATCYMTCYDILVFSCAYSVKASKNRKILYNKRPMCKLTEQWNDRLL